MTTANEALTAAETAATKTARAAADFGAAMTTALDNPTPANIAVLHAAEAAFGSARAAEAIAKAEAVLAILAA
jgi:hypothetical protein